MLIIDCDMRKPRMNKFFNVPAVPGLSNVLAGLCKAAEAIHTTEYKNLDLIPSGILPPNPAELLMSVGMEELMDQLRLDYDLIILDTPPVNVVSDAVAVTKIADGVVLVVRHSVTFSSRCREIDQESGVCQCQDPGHCAECRRLFQDLREALWRLL